MKEEVEEEEDKVDVEDDNNKVEALDERLPSQS